MLAKIDERLAAEGITLWLAGLNPETLNTVRRSPLGERLGDRRMFVNAEAAAREFERQHGVQPATITVEDPSS